MPTIENEPSPTGMCQAGGSTPNPIIPATGEKYYTHTDWSDSAADGLSFSRTFRSRWSVSGVPSWPSNPGLGKSWAHNYSAGIVVENVSTSGSGTKLALQQLRLIQGDGTITLFQPSSNGAYKDTTGPSSITTSGSNYVLSKADDDSTWVFDASGKLLSTTSRNGWVHTYSYYTSGNGIGQLASVTNAFGRSITFGYNASGQLVQVNTPDGQTITLGYDSSARLATASRPGSAGGTSTTVSKTYLYENTAYPQSVTGFYDERGQRLASVSYDSQGRATYSGYAAGANSYSVSYPSSTGGTTYVTDPLGVQRGYTYSTTNSRLNVSGATLVSGSSGASEAASRGVNNSGLVESETDFLGINTVYSWDTNRQLLLSSTQAASRPEARTSTTQWHSTWRLPVQTTEPGLTTQHSYDNRGNLLERTETDTSGTATNGQTRTHRWTWGDSGGAYNQITSYTDPTGAQWQYGYDAAGNRTSETDPLGRSTSYSYNTAGRVSQIVAPNGLTTAIDYDSAGHITQVSQSGSGIATETTRYTYTADGQVQSITQPDGYQVSYQYDNGARLIGASDNRGATLSYTLDGMGNRTSEQLSQGGAILWSSQRSINQINRLASITQGGGTTRFGYDAQGQLTSITDPLGQTTSYTLDGLGRPSASRLADGNQTAQAFAAVAEANALASARDPKGIASTYTRNGWGETVAEQSPDTGATHYTLDSAGRPLTQTNALGQTTRYAYNSAGQLVRKDVENNSTTDTYTYSYDSAGQLIATTEPHSSTRYERDALGRILAKTQTVLDNPSAPSTFTTQYRYHPGGQLAELIYPSGLHLYYRLGTGANTARIVQLDLQRPGLVDKLTSNAKPFITNIQYNALGQPTSWTWQNTSGKTISTAARSYDSAARLTANEFASYQYDAAGRITAISEQLTTNTNTTILLNWSLAYDSRNRLTSIASNYASHSYQYDANGNRASTVHQYQLGSNTATQLDLRPPQTSTYQGRQFQSQSTSQTHTLDASSNQTTGLSQTEQLQADKLYQSTLTTTNTLDAAGRTTSTGLRQYRFDANNQLTAVAESSAQDAGKSLYWYNAQGQRVFQSEWQYTSTEQTTEQAAQQTTEQATDWYQALLRLLGMGMGMGSNSAEVPLGQLWSWAEDTGGLQSWQLLSETGNGGPTPAPNNDYIWLPVASSTNTATQPAQLVGLYTNDKAYAVHIDHLGTPRRITDTSAKTVWQWPYDGYAENAPLGPLKLRKDTSGKEIANSYRAEEPRVAMNLRFAGQYWDDRAQLAYNQNRWYSTQTGRYITPDPLGLDAGWNRFGYVGGNPLSYTDPDGLQRMPGYTRPNNARDAAGYHDPRGNFVCEQWNCPANSGACSRNDLKRPSDFLPAATSANVADAPSGCTCTQLGYRRDWSPPTPEERDLGDAYNNYKEAKPMFPRFKNATGGLPLWYHIGGYGR
ncbi:hypothetical protein KIK84_09500 [Curvibacter sp. CHRR-16]|uniref:RHS repeat-associated core domain-containing protein n=1 Tax=Curvibacter sp. CHRR-16 TaxID=2835872 RepID=UPI001BD92FE0|nr:RHS repeat-associated core domain-containing protein [Curvibacter sp. CHRR-16]MBT0570565.1 hypothetical protein [Curvibacter sp. CHRR-16]